MNVAKAIVDGLFFFCLLMGMLVIKKEKTPRLRMVNWTVCIAALATSLVFSYLSK